MQSPGRFEPVQEMRIGEDIPQFLQEKIKSTQYQPWKQVDDVWNRTQQANNPTWNNRINQWSYPIEDWDAHQD